VISKEPLGPAVAKGDEEWAAIVRWTLAALINAEEVGLTKAMAGAKEPLAGDANRLVQGSGPIGVKLGLSSSWVRDIIAGVGNYGEVFETNVGSQSPLGMERGINALWKRGGLLYAPPMW
jgi:general L-amino acid transport system substrate-binding protein